LALVAAAAALADLRAGVVLLLIVGTTIAVRREAPVRWTWAAATPVAVSLAFGGLLGAGTFVGDEASCIDPASAPAALRAIEALVVLGVVLGLALVLKASRQSIWLRWPARRWVGWAILGFLVAGPVALLLGPIVAEPFFGPISYALPLAALAPALLFAVSNGVMEEVIYRGVLLGWSARIIGIGPALAGQAVVFGIAHSGSDVLALQVPLMIAMGVGGLVAGIITVKTRSLLIPIAVHISLDLPIYFALACPIGEAV
jgi:membrane protease YdiL (CAAX protease family)